MSYLTFFLLLLSGRLKYIQYMPLKPIKRGIKVFCRNASSTGYLYDGLVYLGKDVMKAESEFGIYFDIVTKLCNPLIGNSHTIFMDNLYSSVPLFRQLLNDKIYAAGTVRRRRKYFPSEFDKPPKMRRGESRTWQDSNHINMSCTLWEDTKTVRFVSTATDPATITTGVRRISGRHTEVQMPVVAKKYGKYMGGTDRHDRLRLCYSLGRTSVKAWKYIFWFFVNSSIVNSWILYTDKSSRETKTKKYTHYNFRHELAIELIGGFSGRKRKCPSRPIYEQSLQPENAFKHDNVKVLTKGTRRCVGHKKFKPDGKDKLQTVYSCLQCGLPLCKKCHFLWHNQ